MRRRYLLDDEVAQMADAAFAAYEMTGDVQSARRAAREYAIDEFGVDPSSGAVGLATRYAHLQWMGTVATVKELING